MAKHKQDTEEIEESNASEAKNSKEDAVKQAEAATAVDAVVSPEGSGGKPSSDDGDLAAENTALIKRLSEAEAVAQDHQARYLRAVADLENYRRRMTREKQETIRSAAIAIVEDLLAPLDNLKLGLQAAEQHEGAKDIVHGLKMVMGQFTSSLQQHGLQEINPEGEDFDPNLHEAVAQTPSEALGEGKIVAVQRVGYQLNDRLLRAAAVVVSSGSASTASDE